MQLGSLLLPTLLLNWQLWKLAFSYPVKNLFIYDAGASSGLAYPLRPSARPAETSSKEHNPYCYRY